MRREETGDRVKVDRKKQRRQGERKGDKGRIRR